MAGRFNKILEFIGLVDDEPDEELDQRYNNRGGQSYGGGTQARRSPTPAPTPRQPRGSSQPPYDGGRSGDRYSSPRPDYDARQRRDYNQQQPRYGSDTGRYSGGDYRSAGAPRDYNAPARDYGSQATRDRRTTRDALEDEFEQRPTPRAPQPSGKIVPMNPQQAQSAGHQTVIYYLRNLEECRDVINDLLDAKSVLLNLEDMDERAVQRSIDTLCGAAFALGATLRKASDKTYLIAPNNVMVASTNDNGRNY